MGSKPPIAKSTLERLPLLPLKDAVVFPRMIVPLMVGRPASLAAIEVSLATGQPLFLCTQRDPTKEEPGEEDLYGVGVAANPLQTIRLPDGTIKVVVEALWRGTVRRIDLREEVSEALVESLPVDVTDNAEVQGLVRATVEQFDEYARNSQRISPDIVMSIRDIGSPDQVADSICAYLPVRVEERQSLLELQEAQPRLERIAELLVRENDLLSIERSVRDRVREQMERGQREQYLHEQLKAIQTELGQRVDGGDDFSELRTMISKARMPKDVREKAQREYARYERMPMLSPESAVIRTYLEWLCDMPWAKRSRDAIDIEHAQTVLERDHYGLSKVKERILDFLAVRQLNPKVRGPILCLVGPPGVGKTSLGQSIADAIKRKFVRVSLGGIRDEAEIRGHRRTYIGALPGRIVQSLKRAGVKNPVFLLDEIDKMNGDFRGDPAAALLEALDPAQNKAFSDHYLEVDFDLSEVFFICTANNEFDIPYALHDRLEMVRLEGYTTTEKEHIARRFLLPRQLEASGLREEHVALTDAALDTLIQRYTREAGVRELDRQLAQICRKTARKVVASDNGFVQEVDADLLLSMLGPPPYSAIRSETTAAPGVAIGMAWTQTGGDVLTIETSVAHGKGRLTLTGSLGDVMKESAQAGHSYLRAHAEGLGLSDELLKSRDVHIHVPEGAIPKDGPSAGVTMVVSMLSAFRDIAPEAALAMTGEVTLRGRVLPVGGIKEKVLAAHRAGIRTILLPQENEKDVPEIPEEVREDIGFVFAEHVDTVLQTAFGERLTATATTHEAASEAARA